MFFLCRPSSILFLSHSADFSSSFGMARCSRCDRDGCLDLNRVTVVTVVTVMTVVILVVLAMVISDQSQMFLPT